MKDASEDAPLDVSKIPGLTFEELKPCQMCGEPLLSNKGVRVGCFYRVTVENVIPNYRAIQQRAGLELLIPSPGIASVFAREQHAAKVLSKRFLLVCFDCYISKKLVETEGREPDE